ncbi:UDP-3-O-(3-hydroxymyristoyl)glucosamine N-acyltransferase [Polaribacter sp. Z022]|uniref:UDP-3-O-(3-hydroxymyristoyl)glucosamine N-acyltransferase n=1 Tax=Polaribacter sp. Z022 TaxID=2927125 RepID=UPI002020439B|nr:UDP-3-O-(3-hydroxymyristoyl)glucosamine N-acyltransferase [Polaribacter sp. Z022]MCL7754055.1 UDP-3-O-(3-hydroxymyristoyl)glucosamine N-acyltransferase [Polaribacter sp. Z022]
MKFTAQQIADILEGDIVGNPNEEVSKLSKIEEGEKGSLTFLSNPKYNHYLYTTNSSVAIVNKTFIPEKEINTTLIKVENAYKSFSKLLEFYNEVKNNKVGIEQPNFIAESSKKGTNIYVGAFSYIGENVVIGENVKIYPNTFIGDNATIGDNTVIFSGVKIYSETVIGNNCKIHSGAIIGSDGFGFAPDENGEYKAIPQIGNVLIEDNVDIGSACTIDRATMGSTIIRKGVKLDNQIQVAHNVEIGKNTVIASQTGIAGSTKIGENCMIGGQVGISGHIKIGNNVKILAQAGISKSIKDNEMVNGTPAFKVQDFNKSYVYFKNLPKIISKVNNLEKELKTQKSAINE